MLSVAAILILRETYAPVLICRAKAAEKGEQRFFQLATTSTRSPSQTLRAAFVRPFKFFFMTLMVPIFAAYTSISYAYLNVLFATLGTVYESRYHFQAETSGLVYLGMTVGFILSLITIGAYADRHLAAMYARCGCRKPEYRLPPSVLGSFILPAAIFWYGWALEAGTHWLVPIVATTFVALGAVYSYMAVQMYLVDAYTAYAASATGAVSIFRAICATTIPLAANPAYDKHGYGWGNSIFALTSLPFLPLAIAMIVYGEKLRTAKRFQPEL